MEPTNNSFEKALFFALKNNGFLFPINDEMVNDFERHVGETVSEIPISIDDPSKFIPKAGKVVKLVPKNTTPILRSLRYAKVASKRGPKKGKKKK